MKRNNNKLYNLIFPIWILWLIPVTWIVVLPANFIIDLLVVVITMKCLKIQNIKENAKNVIFSVWLFGFIADFIGTAGMYLSNVISFDMDTELGKWWYHNISSAVSYTPFDSIYALLWITVCVLITGFFIYLFNYKHCLNHSSLTIEEKKKVALSLAIFTAPYVFYIPTSWFF